MSLLQDKINQHLEERGWGNDSPDSYAKSICLEAAELLEHFQWSSPTAEKIRNDPTN